MKKLLRWVFIGVLIFGFVGCGGGGSNTSVKEVDKTPVKDNNSSKLATIKLADVNHTISVSDAQVGNILTHKSYDNNISNGIRVITIDGALAKEIKKDSKIITIPAGSAEYPLGYTGKIVEVKENTNGIKELKVKEATIRDLGSITIPDQTLDLKKMNFVGVISAFDTNTSVSNKAIGRNNKWVLKEGSFPDFNYDEGKIKLQSKGEATFTYELNDNIKLELKGEISNLKIKSTNSKYIVSTLPTDIDFSQNLELSFDSDFSLALVGKAEYVLGFFNKEWKNLEKSSLLGLKIKGMGSDDKKGKIPLAGFVFNTAGVPTPNISTAIESSKPLGLIIWIYIDMSGKLTLNGSIGMASHTHNTFSFKKTMEQMIPDIHAKVTAQEGKRYLEAPFINGDVKLSLTKGLSIEADGIVAGIRVFNLGLAIKTTLDERIYTDGNLSYGLDTPDSDWSWSDGVLCSEGSFGAGAIATATFEVGIGDKASIGLKGTVQYPSEDAIKNTDKGLIGGLWYKGQFHKKCYNLPNIGTLDDNHIEKHRKSISIDKFKTLADENYKYAYLSNRIYDDNPSDKGKEENNWKTVDVEYTKLTGFKAGLYQNLSTDEYILAYGGTTANSMKSNIGKLTDSVIDLVADAKLLSSSIYGQPEEALAYLNKITTTYNLDAITGHSLGGGLAQYAGVYSGIKTVTFNTAPMPYNMTKLKYFPLYDFRSVSSIVDGDRLMKSVHFNHEDKLTNIMTPYDPISSISTILMSIDKSNVGYLMGARYMMDIPYTQNLDYLITGKQIFIPVADQGGFANFANHSMDLIEKKFLENTNYNLAFNLGISNRTDKTNTYFYVKNLVITDNYDNKVGMLDIAPTSSWELQDKGGIVAQGTNEDMMYIPNDGQIYELINHIYLADGRELSKSTFILPAPKNLKAIATIETITLHWDKIPAISAYKICYSKKEIIDADMCEENGGTLISSTSTTETIDTLEKSSVYHFRVRAITSKYKALWSDEVTKSLKENGDFMTLSITNSSDTKIILEFSEKLATGKYLNKNIINSVYFKHKETNEKIIFPSSNINSIWKFGELKVDCNNKLSTKSSIIGSQKNSSIGGVVADKGSTTFSGGGGFIVSSVNQTIGGVVADGGSIVSSVNQLETTTPPDIIDKNSKSTTEVTQGGTCVEYNYKTLEITPPLDKENYELIVEKTIESISGTTLSEQFVYNMGI